MSYFRDSVLENNGKRYKMGWIDTHCHLNDDTYDTEIQQLLERALEANVERMIVVGYDLPSSEKALHLAEQYPSIYAVVGIHPSESHTFDVYTREKLVKLVMHDKVVGIGEIGLDYYWDENPPAETQRTVFLEQLHLAREVGKPVIIHTRDAAQETYDILKEEQGITGVMHCYSGSYEMAARFVQLGYYISLAGPVTFKNAVAPKEVASKIPLDHLLIETDCPYLTPHPYRGKRNEPSYVMHVGQEVARLRNLEETELMQALERNAKKLFKF